LRYQQDRGQWFLRVIIDRLDGQTVDLDLCVSVSEDVSKELDLNDPLPGEYVLEVASPGAERPLQTEEQYRKAIGRDVLVIVHEPVAGYNELVGLLLAVEDEHIVLQYKIKTRVFTVEIRYDNIAEAMTTVHI
jgi:ribosome maturation factor RimP